MTITQINIKKITERIAAFTKAAELELKTNGLTKDLELYEIEILDLKRIKRKLENN